MNHPAPDAPPRRWMLIPVAVAACFHAAACVGNEPEIQETPPATTDSGPAGPPGPPGGDGGASDASSVDGPSDASSADADASRGPAYIFLTIGKFRAGDLGGLIGADGKCAAEATALELPGTYVAWLSTSKLNAINRLPAGGGPWLRREDDAVVIGNRSQLAGGGGVSLPVALGGSDWVWTSTTKDGEAVYISGSQPKDYRTCSDWTSVAADESGYGGEAASAGDAWTYGHSMPCNLAYPIYCLRTD